MTASIKGSEEARIQKKLVAYLRERGWLVERIIGNAFQMGLPDLYLFRRDAGSRWVDVKVPGKYSFTKAQKIKWPYWHSLGLGVWILTAASQAEYDKLFAPANWQEYWKDSWGVPDVDAMIDELLREEE